MEYYYFQIIYWSRPAREGGNHYDLKKKRQYVKKNAKIASIAGRHNVFTETFTIPKKN